MYLTAIADLQYLCNVCDIKWANLKLQLYPQVNYYFIIFTVRYILLTLYHTRGICNHMPIRLHLEHLMFATLGIYRTIVV